MCTCKEKKTTIITINLPVVPGFLPHPSFLLEFSFDEEVDHDSAPHPVEETNDDGEYNDNNKKAEFNLQYRYSNYQLC